MRTRSHTCTTLLCSLAVLLTAFAAHAQNIRYTTIDVPGAVAETTVLTLNNRGEFVGAYKDANGLYHGFFGRRGQHGFHYTKIDYPGATQTLLVGLTDAGVITGGYMDSAGAQHGFVRIPWGKEGRFFPIDVPGAVPSFDYSWEIGPGLSTTASGLNEHGDIVGQYADANQVGHGFILHHNRYTRFDHPLASQIPGYNGATALIRINNAGEMVGSYSKATDPFGFPDQHGFFFSKGQFTPIDPPGTIFTQVFALNERREIGGFFYGPDFIGHGYIYRHGRYTLVDVPGAFYLSSVGCINESGDFSGEYVDAKGITHGYIATCR